MNPAQIRGSLRRGDSPSLRRRRKLAWLGAAALIDSAVMTLFQMGALRHLPDLPGFASDAVVGSRAAYALGTPDAPLNALSTSVMLVLAGAGGEPRHPMFDVLLGASVVANAAGAVAYLADMIFR